MIRRETLSWQTSVGFDGKVRPTRKPRAKAKEHDEIRFVDQHADTPNCDSADRPEHRVRHYRARVRDPVPPIRRRL